MSGARYDVIVVGAGPAGSTAAALLAQRGHRVLVLEKDAFPRFHIGESLLPAGLPVLDRLGIEPCAQTFVYKRGAEFVCEATGRRRVFGFEGAMAGCRNHSWHVERSAFDTALRDRAAACGAEVRHGVAASDVEVGTEGVHVRAGSDVMHGRYLVDATGQDRLLAQRHGSIEPYRHFGSVAVFTHFEGISDATVAELGPGNDIRIILRPDGWGWIIPLPARRLSIGLVSKRRVTPGQLDAGLLSGPLARRWTAGAKRLTTRVIRNFSYRNSKPIGPRFAAIGDAACFLDPVFSSGVTLAMRSAEVLADTLGPAIESGREATAGLLDGHQQHMDRGYRTFAALIDRFYNSRFAQTMFLGDGAGTEMYPGVMSVLAGDVWRTDNPFQELLLRARQRAAGHAQ